VDRAFDLLASGSIARLCRQEPGGSRIRPVPQQVDRAFDLFAASRLLDALSRDEDPRSPLARAVGAKGYHDGPTGVYTN